eukprot:5766872-Alexandrium_andersonii.AAC.1
MSDHMGRPWPDDSPRQRVAGLPFADSYKLIYVATSGDMKFIKETFLFDANYSRNQVCHECFATKAGGECCYTDVRENA